MDNILFTIIIPHKNIVPLLRRCVLSIPSREDIQVVIVDDNSDCAPELFEEIKALQPRVEVFLDKTGQGAGYARNIGLRHAQGDWLLFSDADDIFSDRFPDVLDKIALSTADLVVFDTSSLDSVSLTPVKNREGFVGMYKREHCDENILRYRQHTVWGKAFRKTLIDKYEISFECVPAANDVHFSGMAGIYAKTVEYIDIVGYHSTARVGSITRKNNLRNTLSNLDVVLRYNQTLRQHGVPYKYWSNPYPYLSYLSKIDKKLFREYLRRYLRETPARRLSIDFYRAVRGVLFPR